jgi:DNA-binding transcriptional ArsR family regulator
MSAFDEATAADALAALGNRTRLRLFRLLLRANPDGLIVSELQARMGLAPSTLAHHLAALARVGLIRQERRGREVVSTAECHLARELVAFLEAECCAGLPALMDDEAA